jgi:hypothetical protein
VHVENEICYLIKVLSHASKETITSCGDMFDHWDEFFLEFAIKICNTTLYFTSNSIYDEDLLGSIIRLNPANFIIITQNESVSAQIAGKYNLPF